MATDPFISVVVPTHDRLSLLRETLECLDRQTYPSNQYEIIVVDDGSEDGTESYLHRAATQGKLRYVRQENRGPAVARNRGVEVARGEVIAFTDDDCLPDANWLTYLAEQYTSYEHSRPIAVGGRVENVSDGHWLYPFYAVQGTRHQANQSGRTTYLDTANASFDRLTFLGLGGFDEAFPFPSGEDVDLGFRFVAAGYKLHVSTQALVRHVGSASLKDMMKQSFNRGRGNAFLKVKYPGKFEGPPSRGLRLKVKNCLDSLLRLACRTPRGLRPSVCGVVATLRRVAFFLPETEYFVHTYFAKQVSRYQAMELKPPRFFLYVSLEWVDYLIRLIGQVVGTFSYVYSQVRGDRSILEKVGFCRGDHKQNGSQSPPS